MRFIKLPIPLLLLLGCCTATGLLAQTGTFMKPNQHAYYYVLTPTGFAAPPGQSMFQNGAIALSQYQKTTPRGNSWGRVFKIFIWKIAAKIMNGSTFELLYKYE